MTTAPNRRWFCFSLRTLFVGMTVVGCLLGWLAYNLNWIRERRHAVRWLNQQELFGPGMVESEHQPELPWSLRILGEDSSYDVVWVFPGPEEAEDIPAFRRRMANVATLFPETRFKDFEDTAGMPSH
jgi:hypothetical protein